MDASELMSPDVYVVRPSDNLAHVRKLFVRKGISKVVVFEDEPRGMLTASDITHAFLEERRGIDEMRVEDVMSKRLVTAAPNDSPEKLSRIMLDNGISSVPIMEKGEIIGIITKTDLVRYFAENFKGRAKVEDLMVCEVLTINESQSVFHAMRLMHKHDVERLVVLRRRMIAGIVTKRDLSLVTFGANPSKTMLYKKSHGEIHRKMRIYPLTVGDVMRGNVFTVKPHEDAASCAQRMLRRKVGSLVVEDKGVLCGIVTKTDFLRYMVKAL